MSEKTKNKQQHLKPQMQNAKVRLSTADHTFNIIVNIFMVVILIAIILPLWSTITLSFRPVDFIGSNLDGMFLPPWDWSTAAYESLLGNDGFLMAFMNSFKILIGGVFCALVLTIPMAYVLSVQSLPGKKIINLVVIIPYVFNVGMIPTYLLVRDVGLMNHLAAVFIPGAISTYNCIIMRQFFVGIPNELKESARIDGCSELQVLFKIILPLSKAIVMTIGLYYGVSFWNDFFNAIMYIMDEEKWPLQLFLRSMLFENEAAYSSTQSLFLLGQPMKMAAVMMAIIPIMLVFPFFQKYFAKGITAGAVKG